MILHLIHINLHVTDLERSIAFYEKLGWSIMHEIGRHEPQSQPAVEINDRLEYGGGKVKAVIMTLGDHPKSATKLELMQFVEPAATPKPYKPAHEAGTHRICMRCKDLYGTVQDLEAKGIEFPMKPIEIDTVGAKRFVLFPDPDDNLLELIEF